MAKIFCFGDSITYGAWDVANSGWVQRLRVYLDEKQEEDADLHFLVYNLGIPGETTDGLVGRFLPETAVRTGYTPPEENIFIFAYGANDATTILDQKNFCVSLENFANNLEQTFFQAKKFGNQIFLLNITPVDEELTIGPVDDNRIRRNEYIKTYNNKIKELVGRNSLHFVDVNSAFMSNDYKSLFCEDGVHPNEAGHEIIFAELLKVIKPIIGLDRDFSV